MSKGFAVDYLNRLKTVLDRVDTANIDVAVDMIESAWREGRQIISLGNGGSSLTALHYITDWNKSPFLANGRPFRGRSLIDNVGLITAYANDISFQDVFREQLRNILEPDDLVIAVSGSGNSENVIRAVDYANASGAKTIGLCGFNGGKLRHLAHHVVWVRVDDMQLVEDVHAMFGHIVMQRLCRLDKSTVTPEMVNAGFNQPKA
jgi:D-sedoheptulose 7-phosphate isomerase